MKRKKVDQEPILKNWDEVDDALRQIHQMSNTIDLVNRRLEDQKARLTEEAKKRITDFPERIQVLEKRVEEFCTYQRDHNGEFRDPRSRELPFGTVGFEWTKGKVATLRGWTEKKVVAALRALRKRNFLRYRDPLLDKDAIRESGLGDEDLALFGLQIRKQDEFYYRLKTEDAQVPPVENTQEG